MIHVCQDPRILKSGDKSVLYALSDAVVRFALAAGVYNIVAKVCYSPELAYAAINCVSVVAWLVQEFPWWYSYHCRTADLGEYPRTHRAARDFPVSKPRVWRGVKELKLTNIMARIDTREGGII